MSFKLVQGVSADNYDRVHSAYSVDNESISATVSEELMQPLLLQLVKQLSEPVFFFLEVPCSKDEEKELRRSKSDPFHYNLYYLDNCTVPVAEAIVKRYGQLLVNDGLCRFGFGSHNGQEEIYCLKYQVMFLSGKTDKFKKCFEKLDIPCEKDFLTLWDTFSDDAPGTSFAVEINGESVDDIKENLQAEGLYFADVVEE